MAALAPPPYCCRVCPHRASHFSEAAASARSRKATSPRIAAALPTAAAPAVDAVLPPRAPPWVATRGGGRHLANFVLAVPGCVPSVAPISCYHIDSVSSTCECFDLHREIVPIADACAWQHSVVAKRRGLKNTCEDRSDTLIALQHSPVYSLGSATRVEEDLLFDAENAPLELYRADRGGKVTYHGPGQLVVYPILNIRSHKMDHHRYLRSLEEVIIRALKSVFSINASRVEGLTGVWVGEKKVAAIGIRVVSGIAYHGLALNVTTDLTPFEMIVPCGIKDRGVCSIKEILHKASNRREIDDTSMMDMAYDSLIEEFTELFDLSLEFRPQP
ncbi:hypothetical protein EJB05_55579, partial [Eragrostis curvula]